MKHFFIVPAIALAFVCSIAEAAVLYSDANVSNTTVAASAGGGALTFSPGTEGDDLWNSRAFGNGGDVITSNEASEDAPRLETVVSGLTAGENYDVFAYFWGAGSNQICRGRASLTDDAGQLAGFNTNHFAASSFSPMTPVTSPSNAGGENPGPLSTANAGLEDGGYFTSASILTEEADRRLYQVSLGSTTADVSGNISVFIDDLENTSGANRTWYDGVGTQLTAVPEPGTFGVLAMASMGLVGYRRRKQTR